MNQTWQITDDLTSLLAVLPPTLAECLKKEDNLHNLIEIVLDLGRSPEARFTDGYRYLREEGISREDLEYVIKRVGQFGPDNRAGIERTLHRISAIRNRKGDIIGLTCRVGRAVFGTVEPLRDVIEKGKSILLLGRPGVGKTTMLRELARILSVEFRKRVIVVDTSNEIAGDGDIPHPAIGLARRMQVPSPERQHDVMIEAVENHMPEVIIIDEIGTVQEAQAARTIAERGVQLIGTAHGNSLENLIMNPTLSDLVGGIQAVTLGDEEAKRRGTQKTVLERKAPPTFETIVEIREKDTFAIHHDVAQVVDFILRGLEPKPEIRVRNSSGQYEIVQESNNELLEQMEQTPTVKVRGRNNAKIMGIYPYAVNRNRLEKAIRSLQVPAQIVKELHEADLVVTIKAQYRKEPQKIKEAERRGLPIYVVKSNTVAQLENMLEDLFGSSTQKNLTAALKEAEEAIRRIKLGEEEVELSPQSSAIRKLQHQLASRYNCSSESLGEEPNRRVVIYSS
ncbi:MAG TPA: AAA family ATPase [Clostridia bacterium]|nr:AAA family ATPase [Clostridia bacterium]